MGRSKQNQQVGTGKEKKETRLERRERLGAEAQARETCFKVLPYVGIAVLSFILLFGLWVHSFPPKQVVSFNNGDDISIKDQPFTFSEEVEIDAGDEKEESHSSVENPSNNNEEL